MDRVWILMIWDWAWSFGKKNGHLGLKIVDLDEIWDRILRFRDLG